MAEESSFASLGVSEPEPLVFHPTQGPTSDVGEPATELEPVEEPATELKPVEPVEEPATELEPEEEKEDPPSAEQIAIAETWQGKELDLLIALRRGLEGVDISYLCDGQSLNQPQHVIPISGMLILADSKYMIQTNADETKPVSFSDMVKLRSADKQETLLFVVKKATQVAAHLFQVEPVSHPDGELDVEQNHAQEVVIYPFSLPGPPSVECKRMTPGRFLEENVDLTTMGIAKVVRRFNENAPDEDVSTSEGMMRAMTTLAESADPTKTNNCPYPLVDGICIDVDAANTADRDSDIRSSKLYLEDAANVRTRLADLIGERNGNALVTLCVIEKKDYDAMISQNNLTWARYKQKNLDVATSMHFMLQALVKHYIFAIAQMSVNNRTKLDHATTTWLDFYVRMPVFFFEMTRRLSRFMDANKTMDDVKYEIVTIVQQFQNSLERHVDIFLPPQNATNSELLRNIRNSITQLSSIGKQFKYLPQSFIV